MARDNRRENRAKGKEAGNENGGASSSTGFELDDMLENTIDVEEEDLTDIGDGGDDNGENKDEGETKDASEENKDASKSEAGKEKTADTKDVDNTGADADKDEEGEKTKTDDEAGKKVDEKVEQKPEEKKVEEKKPEPVKQAEPPKKEEPKLLSDDEAASLFTEWRDTTENLLAEHVYKMTEDQVAELNENPAAYIPKAMSRVYLDSISAAFQQFTIYLPRMVDQVLEMKEKNSKNENDFFSAWPELAKHEKGKETVLRLGAAYRQANPGATTEEWINEVGAQAMVTLRLTPTNGHANGANGNGKVDEKTPPVKEKAFKPASNTPAKETPKQKPTNPFEAMAEEFSSQFEDMDDN